MFGERIECFFGRRIPRPGKRHRFGNSVFLAALFDASKLFAQPMECVVGNPKMILRVVTNFESVIV